MRLIGDDPSRFAWIVLPLDLSRLRSDLKENSFGGRSIMHFDLAHAIVTGLIVFAIMQVFQRAGWGNGKRFDWRLVGAIALAVFVLNLVWPA